MQIRQIELREVRMRLLRPFETSFGVTHDRRILLVKVSDGAAPGDVGDVGHVGYGEVTAGEGPYYCHETIDTAWYVLTEFVIPRVIGKSLAHARDFAPLVADIRGHYMARGGLDAALWDLEARQLGQPLWKLLGGTRTEIDTGVSIGIQPHIDTLLQVIQTEVDAGYQRIKIKIRPGWDVDVLRQVRAAFPKIRLMADANSAYTLADVDLFRQMDAFDVMMFEQPLHYEDMIDHAELQRQIRTPMCLDESIHSADDARKAIRIGACRIINIKLGRVGGHREARAVHDVCRDLGIPVWCGGMLESGIGRAHNVALSSLENFSLPGDGAASRRYWAEDVIDPCVEVSSKGTIVQRMEPGIGYSVNLEALERCTVRKQVFSAS